jgi:hypothetical protein
MIPMVGRVKIRTGTVSLGHPGRILEKEFIGKKMKMGIASAIP